MLWVGHRPPLPLSTGLCREGSSISGPRQCPRKKTDELFRTGDRLRVIPLEKERGPFENPERADRMSGGWADAPESRFWGLVLNKDKWVIEDPEPCTTGCVRNDSGLEVQPNSHSGHDKTIAQVREPVALNNVTLWQI